jgi:hypothetical protein
MRNPACVPLAVSALLLLPAAARPQPALDLNGAWAIQFSTGAARIVTVPVCDFQGTANVSQDGGGALSGNISVAQTTSNLLCPATMAANLSGQVTGSQVSMGLVMGGVTFGEASFTVTNIATKSRAAAGALTPGARAAANVSSLSGTYDVTSGPFSNFSGNWSAAQVAAAAVPTLGGSGLALLAALLAAAAALLLWRHPARPRTP